MNISTHGGIRGYLRTNVSFTQNVDLDVDCTRYLILDPKSYLDILCHSLQDYKNTMTRSLESVKIRDRKPLPASRERTEKMSHITTKPTISSVHPAKTDQPGNLPSLIRVFAVRFMDSLGPNSSSCGQRRL